jgi:hypothetical protein
VRAEPHWQILFTISTIAGALLLLAYSTQRKAGTWKGIFIFALFGQLVATCYVQTTWIDLSRNFYFERTLGIAFWGILLALFSYALLRGISDSLTGQMADPSLYGARVRDSWRAWRELPRYRILSPLLTTASRPGATASALFVGAGLPAEQAPMLLHAAPPGAFTGWMSRIAPDAGVAEQLALVAAHAGTLDTCATVCLAPDRPDASWTDDEAIARRVAEAAEAARLHPRVMVWLDTLLDIDRGYFTRNGLADRRMVPRAAGLVLVEAKDRAARTLLL